MIWNIVAGVSAQKVKCQTLFGNYFIEKISCLLLLYVKEKKKLYILQELPNKSEDNEYILVQEILSHIFIYVRYLTERYIACIE